MESFLEVKNLELAESLLRGIPNGLERAVSSTINKTLSKVKTEMKSKVTEEYNIKKKDVEKELSVKKSNFSTLTGTISAKSYRIPLIKFMGTPGKNIRVKIRKKEKSKKVIGKSMYSGKPFISILKNGHIGIFQRKNENKYPIKQLYSLSIAEMLDTDSVSKYTLIHGEKYLEQLMEKEVSRILKGIY